MAVAPSGCAGARPGRSGRGGLGASGREPRGGSAERQLPQRCTGEQAGDAETARGSLLEGDAAECPLRGGAHGGPERAGLEAAEPPPRRPALLHTDAARPGLPQGRQLPPREPLRRGLSRGPSADRAGERGPRPGSPSQPQLQERRQLPGGAALGSPCGAGNAEDASQRYQTHPRSPPRSC